MFPIPNPKNACIYGLTEPLDPWIWRLPPSVIVWILYSQVRYVGKTVEPRARYHAHLRDSKTGTTHRDRWINSYLRDGKKVGIVSIEISSEADWQEREKFWIAWYNENFPGQLTNHTKGGESPPPGTEMGHPVSQETRQKMRDARLGKPFSREHCEAIRRARRGRKSTEAHRKAISRSMRGREVTWAWKISAALKGKSLSDAHKANLRKPKPGSQGEKHHNAKFTESEVIEIRRLYAAGKCTQSGLARQFGVTATVVRSIVTRRTWKHLP